MQEFKKVFLEKYRSINNPRVESDIEDFVRLFFNRRETGNKALMLGVDDASLIKETLGFSGSELIDDETDCLVHVRKVARINQEQIAFAFRQTEGQRCLAVEDAEVLREIFLSYDDVEKFDNAIRGGIIPPLVVKKPIADFFTDIPLGIIKLAGSGKLNSITFSTSFMSHNGLSSSFEDLFIITQSYLPLVLDNKEIAELEHKVGHHGFWDKFKDDVCNPFSFNFVILNNINDHLQRIFIDLLSLYKQRFKLERGSLSVLRRVFFVTDNKFTKETRTSENYSTEINEEVRKLRNDLNDLQSSWRDAELYTCLLSKITSNHRIEELQNIGGFASTNNQQIEGYKTRCIKTVKDTLEEVVDFPNANKEASKYVVTLENLDSKKGRDEVFSVLKECVDGLFRFSDKYAPDALKGIIAIKDTLKSDADAFTSKGVLTYKKSDKEFKQFLKVKTNELGNWWHNCAKKNIVVPSWETMDGAFGSCVEKITEIGKHRTLGAVETAVFLSGCDVQMAQQHFKVNLNKIRGLKKNYEDLLLDSVHCALDSVVNDLASFQNNVGNIENDIKDELSIEELKKMLIDKIAEILEN